MFIIIIVVVTSYLKSYNCKLFEFDKSTWYHITMCKEMVKQIKKCNLKKCNGALKEDLK